MEFFNTRFSKKILILAMILCTVFGSLWATDYQWRQTDAATDEWEGTSNWYYYLLLGWPAAGDYPDETSDNVYFGGDNPVTIKLNSDVEVGNIIFNYQGTSVTSGSQTITIDLNGHSLSCNNLNLNNNNLSSNVIITDSSAGTKGRLTVRNDFDYTDSKDHTLQITGGATVSVNGTFKPAASGSAGSLTISGDSTGIINLPDGTSDPNLTISPTVTRNSTTEYVWNGSSDNDWNNTANWQNGIVPPAGTDNPITIPDSCANYPSSNTPSSISSLVIESGAEFSADSTISITSLAAGGTVSFSANSSIGNLTSTGSLSISSTGRITVNGNIDGDNSTSSLTVTTPQGLFLNGSIGQTSALKNLTINGHYEPSGGAVHPITITGDLTITGDAWLRGDISAATVNLTSGTSFLSGTNSITTTGNQTYSGNYELNNDLTLTSTGGGTVTFTGNLNTHNSSAGSPKSLTFSSGTNAAFEGQIGNSIPLKNLVIGGNLTEAHNIKAEKISVSGTSVLSGDIITTDVQTYNGAVSGTGTIYVPEIASGTAVEFKGGFSGVTLNGASSENPDIVFSGGNVTLSSFTDNDDNLKFAPDTACFFTAPGTEIPKIEFAGNGTTTLTSALSVTDITLTSGTLESGSNNITVSNNWICNGGTFSSSSEVEVKKNVTGTNSNAFYKLKLYGDLETSHPSVLQINILTIAGNSGTVSNIKNSNTIGTFICEVPDKKIYFTPATTQTITTLKLDGTAASTPIILDTTTGSPTWNITALNSDVKYTHVKNSTSNPGGTGEIHTHLSKNLGGNTRWIFSEDYIWTGSSATDSTSWNNNENWKINISGTQYNAVNYPGENSEDDTVTIPNTANKPVFSGAGAVLSDVTISKLTLSASESKLTLNSAYSLKIKTASGLSNSGTVVYSSTARIKNNDTTPLPVSDITKGTVEFTSAATTVDDIGATDYYNLAITTSSAATLSDDITAAADIKINSELLGASHSLSAYGTLTTTAELTGLNTLSVTGTSSIGGDITSSGNQSFNDAVTFSSASVNLNAGTAATVFNSNVTGLSVNPTDATALTLNNVSFNGTTQKISILTVNGTTANSGTINTSNIQIYTGLVTNSGTINVPSLTSGTAVEFKGGLSGTSGTINGAKTNASTLTPDPDIVFSGGNVSFGIFNANDDNVKFTNTAANTFNPNNQTLSSIYFSGTGTTLSNSFTAKNLYLTSGTLNSQTNNISITNDWTHTAGTFISSSTVEVFGNVSGTNSFNELKLHKNLTESHSGATSITKLTITDSAFQTEINASNTIGTLVCEVPGKQIIFTAGTTQTVTSALTLTGNSTNKISLQSSSATAATAADQWNINATGASKSVQYVIVQNSNSADTILTSNSISHGNNINWGIASLFRWTGKGSDKNWKTSDNWEIFADSTVYKTYEYPGYFGGNGIYDDVEINTTQQTDFWPQFTETASSLILNKITTGTSAELTLSGTKNLQLTAASSANPISNAGKIFYTNTGRITNNSATPLPITDATKGTIEFNSLAAIIDDITTGNDYNNLIVNTAATLAGDIKVNGTFSNTQAITSGTSLEVTGAVTAGGSITTTANQTYSSTVTLADDIIFTAADFILKGSLSCKTPYANNLTVTAAAKLSGTIFINVKNATFNSTVTNYNSTAADITFGQSPSATNVIFNNSVSLSSLSISGTTATGSGCSAITTTSNQIYADAVTFADNLTLETSAAAQINFNSSLTATGANKNLTLTNGKLLHTGSLTAGDFTLNNAGSYTNTTAAVSVNNLTQNGTSQFAIGANAFNANIITTSAGTIFTQTGDNSSNTQSVAKIINNGTMTWDSTSLGGTLSVGAGGISQSDITHLAVFNKKNVIFAASPVSASGIFYDLTIPNGIEFTNNLAVVVRRNFTVDGTGSYKHNNCQLHLGFYNLNGTSFASESGIITRSNAPASSSVINFGNTFIRGQNTSKTFEIPAHITTLTADDVSAGSENGSITFNENLTVENFAPVSTKAAITFAAADSAAHPVTTEFTKGVEITSAQKISLGGTLQSTFAATSSVKAPLTVKVPLQLTTDTKIITNGSPVSFGNTVSKGISQSELNITTGTVSGTINFEKTVTVERLTIQNPETLSIESAASVSSTNEITITGNGKIVFGTENSASELVISTINKNILFDGDRTNAKITLNSPVRISTGTAGGDITLNQSIDSKAAGAQNLTLISGKGRIFINNSIGKTIPLGTVNITGITQISASLKTDSHPINFTDTVYISGDASSDTEISSGTEDITIGNASNASDLFINAIDASGAKNILLTAGTIDVKNNFALFNGNITLNANLTASKDIVLLNGNVSAMYDDTGDSSKSGVTNLFDYHNPLRTAANNLCEPSLVFKTEDPLNPGSLIPTSSKYPESMPDGTLINHTTAYSSSLSGFASKTITANQNFYDNGVNLEASSQWTLKIKKNDSAENSFAECYHASIKNILVECTTAGDFAWLSASEDCTDNGFNSTDVNNSLTYNADGSYTRQLTGIAFKHPVILTSSASISASEGRPVNPEVPNFSGTYTVRDNVIRVEFVRSDNSSRLCLIENSNNEIRKAVRSLKMIKYNGDSATSIFFEDVFIDAECTDTTDGKGDIAVIYLKAPDSSRWNYSATGTEYGTDTDSNGIHQTRYSDIEITRALTTVFYSLTDDHKNRIGSFKGTPAGKNSSEGFRFTATATRCAIQQMHIAFSIADFTSNKVYLYFDHPLADDITWNTITKDTIHFYSDIDTQDTSYQVVSVEPHGDHANGVILNLNKNLDYTRAKLQYGIKIEYGASFLFVNKIHSPDNKVVISGESHCISDAIMNCVEVEYAYDNRNDAYIDSTDGIAPADSIAIRDFAGKTKHNKVFADKDITLVTKDISQNLDSFGNPVFTYHAVADITPTLHSDGENFSAYSGIKTRAWFPVTALGSTPLEGFAPVLNSSKNIQTSHDVYIERNFNAASLTTTFLFHNFSEQTPCLNWQSGSDVRFFFEVQDQNGTIEINHLYDGTTISTGTRMTPLYTFRTSNPADYTSIDLWSFIISEPQRQRGGVSIYSNVVNAANKEFCTLEVNMPKEGNLRVIIMTADGNIVKYLENGRQSPGLHYYYWNGTNNSGSTVARGIYFIRVVGPEIEETRKVMIVK